MQVSRTPVEVLHLESYGSKDPGKQHKACDQHSWSTISNKLTWSIAQGIRQGIFLRLPNIIGKDVLNDGAACTAGNAIFPMLSVSTNPNIALAWFTVTHF